MRLKFLDYVFIAIALAICAVLIFKPTGDKPKKLTLISGSETIILPFKNQTIYFKDVFNDINYKKHNINKDMHLEVIDGKVRMTESNCPDKLCVNMSWASGCGDIIICMPNGVAVMIDCKGALDENK